MAVKPARLSSSLCTAHSAPRTEITISQLDSATAFLELMIPAVAARRVHITVKHATVKVASLAQRINISIPSQKDACAVMARNTTVKEVAIPRQSTIR